jgi:long-chain acyl-CoA synthetase
MNKHLSNPEKIKRWAILPNDLGVETGELTPNLKLKRQVITQKYAKIIQALYSGEPIETVAHLGGGEKAE